MLRKFILSFDNKCSNKLAFFLSLIDETVCDPYIVGGSNASINDFPYQVLLIRHSSIFEDFPLCGGSIISTNYILTAGHCVASLAYPSSVLVGVGSYDQSNLQKYSVSQIILNEYYYSRSYDIGLLKLKNSLTFSNSVKAIQLPEWNENIPSGKMMTVSGWGCQYELSSMVERLQSVQVPIVDRNTCGGIYNNADRIIIDAEICAGYLGAGGKDSCQGDSGGPLAANNVIYGVVSWGNGCAQPGYPGVYASVAFFRRWINEHTAL